MAKKHVEIERGKTLPDFIKQRAKVEIRCPSKACREVFTATFPANQRYLRCPNCDHPEVQIPDPYWEDAP